MSESKTIVHDETLSCESTESPKHPEPDAGPTCGYRKCCPRVRVFDDGSVTLTDDDAEAGSVGTIKLRPEVAQRLVQIIKEK